MPPRGGRGRRGTPRKPRSQGRLSRNRMSDDMDPGPHRGLTLRTSFSPTFGDDSDEHDHIAGNEHANHVERPLYPARAGGSDNTGRGARGGDLRCTTEVEHVAHFPYSGSLRKEGTWSSSAFARIRELHRSDVRAYRRSSRLTASAGCDDRLLVLLADVAACAADVYVAGIRRVQAIATCPWDYLLDRGFSAKRPRNSSRKRNIAWSSQHPNQVLPPSLDEPPHPSHLQPRAPPPPSPFVSLPPAANAAMSLFPFLPNDLPSVQNVPPFQAMLWPGGQPPGGPGPRGQGPAPANPTAAPPIFLPHGFQPPLNSLPINSSSQPFPPTQGPAPPIWPSPAPQQPNPAPLPAPMWQSVPPHSSAVLGASAPRESQSGDDSQNSSRLNPPAIMDLLKKMHQRQQQGNGVSGDISTGEQQPVPHVAQHQQLPGVPRNGIAPNGRSHHYQAGAGEGSRGDGGYTQNAGAGPAGGFPFSLERFPAALVQSLLPSLQSQHGAGMGQPWGNQHSQGAPPQTLQPARTQQAPQAPQGGGQSSQQAQQQQQQNAMLHQAALQLMRQHQEERGSTQTHGGQWGGATGGAGGWGGGFGGQQWPQMSWGGGRGYPGQGQPGLQGVERGQLGPAQ